MLENSQLAAHSLFMDFNPSKIGPLVMLRFSVIALTNKRGEDDNCVRKDTLQSLISSALMTFIYEGRGRKI